MPFCVRKSPWLTGSLPSNRPRLPEHTRPSSGQWKACVNRMARGRTFVDVMSLSSSFSVCLGTYLGALEEGVSMRILIIVALALCAFSSQLQAGCTCQCVNGQMQPLCSSALDIAPPCMGICGPVAPSIAPINPPTIPPVGTTSCRQAQICDQFGNCRWQQVCR
jgi:hypothetical protein